MRGIYLFSNREVAMRISCLILTLTVIAMLGRSVLTAEPEPPALTVEEARRQAALLHDTLHTTLQVVHHRYYREDEGLMLPAAALREVFAEIEKQQPVQLHWLAVEGQVMNTDHRPRDEFEESAAEALKADRPFFEEVTSASYRRAGPITLKNHCLKCHVPDRKSTEDRTAGLVITIPLRSSSANSTNAKE